MGGLVIAIGLAVALWAVAVIVLIALGRRSWARELATLIPNLLVLFSRSPAGSEGASKRQALAGLRGRLDRLAD